MTREQIEALERILHYARAVKKGDDWIIINNFLEEEKLKITN